MSTRGNDCWRIRLPWRLLLREVEVERYEVDATGRNSDSGEASLGRKGGPRPREAVHPEADKSGVWDASMLRRNVVPFLLLWGTATGMLFASQGRVRLRQLTAGYRSPSRHHFWPALPRRSLTSWSSRTPSARGGRSHRDHLTHCAAFR